MDHETETSAPNTGRHHTPVWYLGYLAFGLYGIIAPKLAVALSYSSGTGQYSLTVTGVRSLVFNAAGYLLSVADLNNNTTTLTYDGAMKLTQVTDAAARSLTFTYGDAVNPACVTSVQDGVGTVATYQYDEVGRLLKVTYADASFNTFAYDADSQITSITDTDGHVLESHTYDAFRRGLTSSRADGVEWLRVSYDAIPTVTDSLGHLTTYAATTINQRNEVTGITGPGCATCGGRGNHAFVYDASGNRTSSTDQNNHQTAFTYDSTFNVTQRSNVVNGSTIAWNFTYNNLHEVLTATDPLGKVTTNTYSNANLLTTTTPSPGGNTAGSKTTFTYDTHGQVLTVTDPLNHVTTFTYTAAGLGQTVKDAQNHITTFEYDARGNRTALVDALNQRTTFEYDARNRVTAIHYPTTPATSTTFTYDHRGRRTSITDPNGKTTTYGYDDADRLISVIDPATQPRAYAYDTEDHLTSITDALNRVTQFQYDTDGRLTQTTFPSNLTETYGYDAASNLTSKTDRKLQTILFGYDAINRVASKQYPDNTAVNYSYDAASRVTQVSDPTGTYTFTYDPLGRLTQMNTTYAFITGHTFSVGYGYDAASNRTSMTDPQNGATTYTYDTLDRVLTLKNPQRNQFTFTYDALNRRTQLARPNAVNTNYTYDPLSRVTSLLHQVTTHSGTTTLDGATYAYDDGGNALARLDARTNVTASYSYDPIDQLTGVMQGTTATESYTYDVVGNRLSSLGVSPYSYNWSNELTGRPGVTYAYDSNDSQTSRIDGSGTTQYAWDYENRLTRVTLPGGSQVNFTYDPFGRRIQKSASSGTTNYVYDRANILEDVDTSGNLIARYTQDLGIDAPLAVLRSGTTSYYDADALGTITSLSNGSGALANTYTYDSFGKLTASSGSVVNPYRFTGREFDAETGLMYYRARYYDPQIGRFLSEDPIGYVDGPNLYPYVLNNPVNFRDPFGLQFDSVSRSLQAAIKNGDVGEIQNILDATGDVLSPEMRQAGQAAVKRFGSKASDIISKECVGKINRVFPGEMREKTLEEIFKLAKQGNKAAQTARKLLTSGEYLK